MVVVDVWLRIVYIVRNPRSEAREPVLCTQLKVLMRRWGVWGRQEHTCMYVSFCKGYLRDEPY